MKITRHNLPQAFKKGFTPWNKGIKYSEKLKKRLDLSGLAKGHGWNKGKPSPWTSERNRVQNRQRVNEKHWNWQGGKTKERHKLSQRKDYKQWRSNVLERDNYTCQNCGVRGIPLEVHHIKSFAKYPDLRTDIENGVALCKPCHMLTNNFGNKKKLVTKRLGRNRLQP
jgi:5-methylcytosine-specific restriction endonuclease McrA